MYAVRFEGLTPVEFCRVGLVTLELYIKVKRAGWVFLTGPQIEKYLLTLAQLKS